jgi:hypothetical protein
MSDTKSWYQSTTIQGGLINLLVFIDLLFKLNIGGELLGGLIAGVFGLIGITMTIYGRLKAKPDTTITVLGKSFN